MANIYSVRNIIQSNETVGITIKLARLVTVLFISYFSIGAQFSANGQCTVDAGKDVPICAGESTTLNATVTQGTGIFSYSWSPATDLSNSKIQNPVAKPGITRTYTVTLTGGTCIVPAKDNVVVTVNPLPDPVITGAASVCQGSVKNMYSVVNIPGNSYFWTITGGSIIGVQNTNEVAVTWGAAGTGSITVNETNLVTGCKKTLPKSITINALPIVNFTSALKGDACSGRYQFNTTSPIPATGLTYKWTYSDKSSPETTRDPLHQFHPHGDAFQDIITTLIVKNSSGCVDSTKQTISNVKQRPDASLSTPTFKQCGSLGPFNLKITNNSSTKPTNKRYQIAWGDGTPILDLAGSFNTEISHTYIPIGSFDLKFIVTGNNNCIDTVTYLVFNGSNPGLGVKSPGNTTGCTNGSSCFTFEISGIAKNVETNYTFDFGDDSPIENYTQAELELKPFLEHCYLKPSCDRPNSEYILTARAINECKPDGTKFEINSIIVSAPPESKFSNPQSACIGVPLTFVNNSTNGCYIYAGVPSIKAYNHWYVDGVSVKYDPFVEILPNLVYPFTTAGMHSVCLVTWNDCSPTDIDSICQDICISPMETAGFDLDTQNGCSPLEVTATNTSVTGTCTTPTFSWMVSYDDLACPPNTSGWTFTSGTDANTKDPVFSFDNPGIYTITLTILNGCGTGTDPTMSKTVTVKGKPTVTALTPADMYLCTKGQQLTFSPTFTTNCNKPAEPYLWEVTPTPISAIYSFTGGTTNKSEKPTISFADYGDYLIKGTVKNDCGENSTTQTIHVAKPVADNKISITTPSGGELCAGQTSTAVLIEGPVPTDGSAPFSYQWQENLNCDYSASGIWTDIAIGGTVQNYSLLSLTSTRCFRRIVKDKGNCLSPSDPVQVLYKEIKNNDIGNSQQICKNTAPALLTGSPALEVGGTVTYQWEQSAEETANYTPINLTNTVTYQPGSLSITTFFRRAAISLPCPPDYSPPVKITVVDPISNNSISTDPEICQGTKPSTFTSSTPTGAGGSYTYEWQAATETSYPTFTPITGATEATYSPPDINSKTYFRRIVSTPANNCLKSQSNEFTINTLPIPNVKITGPTTPLSNGSSVPLVSEITGGNPPYSNCQWTPENSLKQPTNDCAKVITNNLDSGREFTLTVTDLKGCKGIGKAFVDIQGDALSFTILSNPTIICPGDLVHLWAEASGGSGEYTFKWDGGGNSYFTSAFDVNLNQSTTFTCVVTDKQTGVISIPKEITVEVRPRPVITSPLTAEICSGDQLNYSPTADVAGSTFIWKSDPGANYSGNTSFPSPGKLVIEDKLINLGSADEVVHYSVTPRRPDQPYCEGTPLDLYVTLKPEAQVINSVMIQTVVSGFESKAVNFNSNVTNAGFLWKFDPEAGCKGFVEPQLLKGDSPTLGKQIITLLAGAPSSCTIAYTVTPYILAANGDKCLGSPYTYQYVVNSKPTDYQLICPTPFCKGQSATISLDGSEAGMEYRLYRGSTFVTPMKPGTGSLIDWPGIATVGSYTVIATNPINGQSATMKGMCQITINDLPQIFFFTPQNGLHCAPVIPLLSGSEAGINYRLINNGNINIPVQVKTGTGSAGFLTFDTVSDAGTYTVIALNPLTGCEREMLGSFKVDPIIQQFPVYPGGVLCEGVDLCMDGSEPGITYQLRLNSQPFGVAIQGDANGGPVCFGIPTHAGTYQIHAINKLTKCEIYFDKSYIVNPLPTVFVMSPAEGCPGSEITLNNCQDGFAYYLDFVPAKGPSPKKSFISGPVYCTSGKITFGQLQDAGVYTIKAVDPVTNCSAWMIGSTIIHPEPTAYKMAPQGTACPPADISLEHFDQNAIYYLYRNGDTLVATDNAVDGIIDFGPQILPGIYSMKAQFVFAGGYECWNNMAGTLEIYPEPVKYTLLPSGILCPPAKLFLNGSQSGVTYTLWNNTFGIRQVIKSNSGILQFKSENEPGNYWVTAKTGDSCSATMTGIVTVLPNPTVYHVLPSGQGLCEPTQIGLDGSDINTTYELLTSDGSSLIPPQVYVASKAGKFWFTDPLAAGSYIVRATNASGCDTLMNGIAQIHALPTVDAGKRVDTICSPPSVSISLNGNAVNYSTVLWTSPSNPTGNNFSNSKDLSTEYTFTTTDFKNKQAILVLTAYGTVVCIGSSVTDTITIHLLAPLVDAGSDQAICENESVALNGAVSGGTTTGIWTGGAGTFDDPNSLSTVYHPRASETGTTVTLTLTSTNASPCPDYSDNVTINIFSPLTGGIAGSDRTICFGETPTMLSATLPSGGSGTFAYQWQFSTDKGATWTNVASGGISLIYSTGPLYITTSFRLLQTDTYCAPDQVVYTNDVTITVLKQLVAGSTSVNQTICYGFAPVQLSATIPTGGSGNYSYQWQQLSTAGTWENIAGAIALSYAPSALFDTAYFKLIQTDEYCSPGQSAATNIVSIFVQIPTANAGSDDTVCGLVPYELSHSTAKFAVNYTWTTSGTGSFGSQFQLHSTYFPSPADMNAGSVFLTLTTSDRCKNTVTDNMTLTLSQQPVSFYTFNTPVCSGSPVKFNDLSTPGSGNVSKWIWDFGDGSPADTVNFPDDPNVLHSFAKAGTFAITLTVMNSFGCSDDFTTSVTLLPAPIANFQFLHPCENSMVTFTDASLSNGSGKVISWKWDFDDSGTGINNSSALKDPAHIFSERNKTYNVSLTIVNYNNCSSTIVKQVFVRNAPAVDFTNSKTCLNEYVNFAPDSKTMKFDSISTWHWDFGDGEDDSDRDAAHLFPASGTYTVVLQVVDITGCENFISKEITISPPPLANFNAGDLNCTGTNVHFNELASTSTGYIVKWDWDFGDGNTQTVLHPDNPNVDHTYINSGKYSVKLTIQNSEGCTSSVSYPITVKQSPSANFEFTDPVAAGSAVQFSDLTQVFGGGALLSWDWNFGNPTSGVDNTSSSKNPLHIFNLGGSYNVTLVAQSINTCADTVTKTLTIIASPSVVFSADTVCEGLPTHFNDLTHINNGTINSWYWNFGDGSTGSSLKNPVHTFASTGIYNVKLSIKARIEGILIPDSTTMKVEVKQGPVAGFTTGITCFGQETLFTNTSTSPGSPIDSYRWIFDDPTTAPDISSVIQPKYTYPAAGVYTVQLIAVNTIGCGDTARNQVVVNKLPVANLSITNACTENPVVLHDLSQQGDAQLVSWQWDISGPNGFLQLDTAQNPLVIFTQAGSHNAKLTVTDADGCRSISIQKATVNPSPRSAFSFTGNYENEQGRLLLNNESQNATRYVWDFGNGSYSSDQNPVATYTADGEYVISLVSFNSLNCPDTIKKPYTLLFKGLYIPTAFSPNNPSSKLTMFKPAGVNLKSYKIEVFNKWGQIIWSSESLIDGQPNEGWDGKFLGENMPIGVYLWKASVVFKDDSVWEGQNIGNNSGLSDKAFGTVILLK